MCHATTLQPMKDWTHKMIRGRKHSYPGGLAAIIHSSNTPQLSLGYNIWSWQRLLVDEMNTLQYWYFRAYLFYLLNKKVACKTVGHVTKATASPHCIPCLFNTRGHANDCCLGLSRHEGILWHARNDDNGLWHIFFIKYPTMRGTLAMSPWPIGQFCRTKVTLTIYRWENRFG